MHVGGLHLTPGARIIDPSATRDYAAGRAGRVVEGHGGRNNLSCGMGAVIKAADPHPLESERAAIAPTVEAQRLEPTAQGISTPPRITGQRRPGENHQ